MPGLGLRLASGLLRLRHFLQIVDVGGERIDISLDGADPQHVRDHLRIFGIVLDSAIVQSLTGPGQRDRRNQPQLKARGQQPVRQGAMAVTGGFKADDDRTPNLSEVSCEAVIVRFGRSHSYPPPAVAFRTFDQHLLAVLGHIDGCRRGVGGSRHALGFGQSVYNGLSRQLHFRDLLAGHGCLD